MSVELGTLEWLLLAIVVCPWAVMVAVILWARSTGQFSESKSAMRRDLESHREALRHSHEREIDALRDLIRVQTELETLRKRDVA